MARTTKSVARTFKEKGASRVTSSQRQMQAEIKKRKQGVKETGRKQAERYASIERSRRQKGKLREKEVSETGTWRISKRDKRAERKAVREASRQREKH